MKKLALYAIATLVVFGINFAIYNISFNMQATPYLSEEQRLDSGMLMLQTTLPAYLVSSVVIVALCYFIVTYHKK